MLATRRKRKEITEVNVYLNSKPLQQAKSIKYLGITLDTKLNIRKHIILEEVAMLEFDVVSGIIRQKYSEMFFVRVFLLISASRILCRI